MISLHRGRCVDYDPRSLGSGWIIGPSDVDSILECIVKWPWSPMQWHNGIRKQTNFCQAQWVALDFDDGKMEIGEAQSIFQDCVHMIGPTKSHRKDKGGIVCDRFRVLLRLETPIEQLGIYRATLSHYIKKYGSDPQCVDGARFFWPCQSIFSSGVEGRSLKVIQPTIAIMAKENSIVAAGILNPWAYSMLRTEIPEGHRNTVCWQLGNDLAKAGYSPMESCQIVINSRTYGGKVSCDLEREIYEAVSRGWHNAIDGGECATED